MQNFNLIIENETDMMATPLPMNLPLRVDLIINIILDLEVIHLRLLMVNHQIQIMDYQPELL